MMKRRSRVGGREHIHLFLRTPREPNQLTSNVSFPPGACIHTSRRSQAVLAGHTTSYLPCTTTVGMWAILAMLSFSRSWPSRIQPRLWKK